MTDIGGFPHSTVDQDLDDDEKSDFEDAIGSVEFNQIVDWVKWRSGGLRSYAADFVDEWGDELRAPPTAVMAAAAREQGRPPSEYPSGLRPFPSYQDLVVANADFRNGAEWLNMWPRFPQGAPPMFNVAFADGTIQAYTPDFLRGGQEVRGGVNPAEAAARGVPPGFVAGIPLFNLEDLLDAPPKRGGGRGGRADRVFDRDELLEAGDNMWRGLLLASGDKQVVSAVNEYMRQASGFWKTKGGSLDFQTFMMGRIRKTSRYGLLYEHKPKHLSEAQFMANAQNTVNSFTGLRPSDKTREVETTLTSGGSLAGQAERIGGTERVFRANPSAFTTRLANTVSRLGRGALR